MFHVQTKFQPSLLENSAHCARPVNPDNGYIMMRCVTTWEVFLCGEKSPWVFSYLKTPGRAAEKKKACCSTIPNMASINQWQWAKTGFQSEELTLYRSIADRQIPLCVSLLSADNCLCKDAKWWNYGSQCAQRRKCPDENNWTSVKMSLKLFS